MKIILNPGPKAMRNRCENDARKSDAKITKNGGNMETKMEPTFRKV